MKKGKLRHSIVNNNPNPKPTFSYKKIQTLSNNKNWKKRIILFFVSMFLLTGVIMVLTYRPSPKPAMVIDTYIAIESTDKLADSLVDNFIQTIKLEPKVDSVLKKAEFYRSFLKENFKKAKGLKIDFIANFHYSSLMGNQIPEGVYKSQKEIRKILDYHIYDAVGWEMSACDSLSPQAYDLEQDDNERYQGKPLSNPMAPNFPNLTSNDVPLDAVFGYWLDHQEDANIVGEQEISLWRFYTETANNGPIFFKTRSFVSYIGLAKMISSITKHGYKDAVAIFGSYHTADFVYLAKRLGIKMKIFDACRDGTYEKSISTL
jgi:hypothetical protein